jgi:hypothetical protein
MEFSMLDQHFNTVKDSAVIEGWYLEIGHCAQGARFAKVGFVSAICVWMMVCTCSLIQPQQKRCRQLVRNKSLEVEVLHSPQSTSKLPE